MVAYIMSSNDFPSVQRTTIAVFAVLFITILMDTLIVANTFTSALS